mgnify:CR=1 FL=1
MAVQNMAGHIENGWPMYGRPKIWPVIFQNEFTIRGNTAILRNGRGVLAQGHNPFAMYHPRGLFPCNVHFGCRRTTHDVLTKYDIGQFTSFRFLSIVTGKVTHHYVHTQYA